MGGVIWSVCPSNLRHRETVAQGVPAKFLHDLRAFEANIHVGKSPVDLLVDTQTAGRRVKSVDYFLGE
jgi:hypothetical protein